MADKAISGLPTQTSPPSSAYVEISNSGVSEKSTITNVLAATVTAYQAADSAIQSQVTTNTSDKANLANPTFTGNVNVPAPTIGTDATNKTYVDTLNSLKASLAGANFIGVVDLGANKITGVAPGTTGTTDAANVTQMEAADAFKSSYLENYNVTGTSAAPVLWNGATIKKGARFYMTNVGTFAGATVSVGVGDTMEAKVDSPTNTAADWSVIQANVEQATTSIVGISAFANGAETLAQTEDAKSVTPLGLASLIASESKQGLIEIATQDEVDAGGDGSPESTTRAVTPATLAATNITILSTKVTLTSAEILDLLATPKTIIPAPGANKVISIIDCSAFNNFNTTAYSAGTDVLELVLGSRQWSFSNFFLETAGDLASNGEREVNIDMALNTALQVQTPSTAPTLGDGTITIVITYKIADFS